MKRTTRRSFLMSSALGAAAVAGMGKALAAPSKLDANPATPKPTYRMMREIPVDEGYDLVVAGGGPAGVAAAVCAARLGVKVLLLEATGCLGGMGTNAYVSNWYSMGDGQQLFVGGFIVEVMHALCREGFATPSAIENFNKKKYLGAVGFNPEGLKLIFDKLCVAAGVEVRFYTRVIDADADRSSSICPRIRVVMYFGLLDFSSYSKNSCRIFYSFPGNTVESLGTSDVVHNNCG